MLKLGLVMVACAAILGAVLRLEGPGPAEHSTLDPLTRARTLRGRVEYPDGTTVRHLPIVAAMGSGPDAPRSVRTTDERGEFVFDDLFGSEDIHLFSSRHPFVVTTPGRDLLITYPQPRLVVEGCGQNADDLVGLPLFPGDYDPCSLDLPIDRRWVRVQEDGCYRGVFDVRWGVELRLFALGRWQDPDPICVESWETTVVLP